MDIKRKQAIKAKAADINNFSEQFQLLHATYASQEYIRAIVQEYFQEQLDKIRNRIKEKMEKGLNAETELKEASALTELIKKSRFAIDIGYIDISNEDVARVTKNGKSFSIYLARSLKDKIHEPDGSLNYQVLRKIRELMAHELGHIVLHTREVLEEQGTQGTINIKDSDREEEADEFADELLFLRRERNKRIREDGGADRLL